MSATAIGWICEVSQEGTGWTSIVAASWRMISNDVEPAPSTTPARNEVTEARERSSTSSTSSRDDRWCDSWWCGRSGTSPDR